MKIYFTGCHGSGKTTLARYVSEKYKVPLITEVARQVLSEKELHIDTLRHNLEVVDEYQTQIFYRQLQEEQAYSTSFVSDRSALDALCYAGQHSRVVSQLFQSPQLTEYLGVLRQPDSYLFFVRPCKATLRADGVRESLNWDGAVAIDAMLKLLLEIFEIRYFQINTDNMQERVKLINSVLGNG
jgi:predicted ATPase